MEEAIEIWDSKQERKRGKGVTLEEALTKEWFPEGDKHLSKDLPKIYKLDKVNILMNNIKCARHALKNHHSVYSHYFIKTCCIPDQTIHESLLLYIGCI